MTKSQKFKKTLSQPNMSNLTPMSKSVNPFELHFNRRKHNVIGWRVKGESGKPTVSRLRAYTQRKRTIRFQKMNENKSNRFSDTRIGANGIGCADDDTVTARFTTERRKQHRLEKFNLDDDDINNAWTHMGQSLAEIENLNDGHSGQDVDDDEDNLSHDFVKVSHFGGGSFSDSTERRKNLIDRMIDDSKKRKMETKKLRDENEQLTILADEKFRLLNSAVKTTMPKCSDAESVANTYQDYDSLVKQLSNQPRAMASTSFSQQEKAALAQQKHLDTMSAEQQQRMLDETDVVSGSDETKSLRVGSQSRHCAAVSSASHTGAGDIQTHISADTLHITPCKKSNRSAGIELVGDRLVHKNTTLNTCISKKLLPDTISEPEPDLLIIDVSLRCLVKTLASLTLEQKLDKITSTIHSLDPSLSQHNRPRLLTYYSSLLRYTVRERMFVTSSEHSAADALRTIDAILPLLYDIGERLRTTCGAALARVWLRALRRARRRDVAGSLQTHITGSAGDVPVPTLFLLHLCAALFPVSDRRHPVTLSAALLICSQLDRMLCGVGVTMPGVCARARHVHWVCGALYLCTLLLEWTRVSRRFVPELVLSLQTLLALSTSGSLAAVEAAHSRLAAGHNTKPLLVQSDQSAITCSRDKLRMSDLFVSHNSVKRQLEMLQEFGQQDESLVTQCSESGSYDGNVTDQFRVTCLHVQLSMWHTLMSRHESDLVCAEEVFYTGYRLMKMSEFNWYPESIKDQVVLFVDRYERLVAAGKWSLQRVFIRPKPLRQYEPAIDSAFDRRRKKSDTAGCDEDNDIANVHWKMKEHQRLKRKYRRVMRSTVKDIRRDSQVVARCNLRDKIRRDKIRETKVKCLLSSLANQEGECRKLKRDK